MTSPSWNTEGIDLNLPTAARMYDYYLGGFHNFEADRILAQKMMDDVPDVPLIVKANRAFLQRSVTALVDLGVRQFLDIGSGIPTVGNVHEAAQYSAPEARVVYVDIDPVAVAHSREILAGNPNTAVVQADMRRPGEILADPALTGLFDLDRPVAVLMFAVLHFINDADDPGGLISTFAKAMAPGSYLVISHSTHELHPDASTDTAENIYKQTATPLATRTRAEVQALFAGFDLLDPGVVLLEKWRPGPAQDVEHAERYPLWAGVGRKA